MSSFLGFILATDAEEFYAGSLSSQGVISHGWSAYPAKAKRYPTFNAAKFAVRRLARSYPIYVLELRETENQFQVLTDQEERPSWLS